MEDAVAGSVCAVTRDSGISRRCQPPPMVVAASVRF
jgi:hypothetical protein